MMLPSVPVCAQAVSVARLHCSRTATAIAPVDSVHLLNPAMRQPPAFTEAIEDGAFWQSCAACETEIYPLMNGCERRRAKSGEGGGFWRSAGGGGTVIAPLVYRYLGCCTRAPAVTPRWTAQLLPAQRRDQPLIASPERWDRTVSNYRVGSRTSTPQNHSFQRFAMTN